MHIKIHTKGITGSSVTKDGEDASALFAGFLEIDGVIYDRVTSIKTNFGEEFATVDVTFIPGDIEVVSHTESSWPQILQQALAQEDLAKIRRSDGRVIAVYVSPVQENE